MMAPVESQQAMPDFTIAMNGADRAIVKYDDGAYAICAPGFRTPPLEWRPTQQLAIARAIGMMAEGRL